MGIGGPGFKSKPPQAIFAEVSANNAVFTKSGNVSNAYLQVGTVVSDNTGFPVRLTNAEITYVAVQVQNAATFTVSVYEWNGTTENLLLDIAVTSARSGDNTPVVPISVTQNNELRVKVSSGSCKDVITQVFFSGELVT